jgi:hypothetical protein
MSDDSLHDLLRTLSPSARDHLRRVLIRDLADCDAISSQLMRYRDENGAGLGGHHRPVVDVPGREAPSSAGAR